MSPLLTLTGEVVAIGDMQPEDMPALNTPRALLRLNGSPDRYVLITGLTMAECRSVAAALMEQVTVSIGGAA
ncbi:MAG: hypothetical protein IV107_16455 [Paucibacter sp.]|nr:hypothetical protein [Roseateles sp.]